MPTASISTMDISGDSTEIVNDDEDVDNQDEANNLTVSYLFIIILGKY